MCLLTVIDDIFDCCVCITQECEYETIVPYKLSEHKTTVHSGLACVCETCGRAFKSKSVLKYHIQSNHSESRPTYICNTCGKTYFTAQALRVSPRVSIDSLKILKDQKYFFFYILFFSFKIQVKKLLVRMIWNQNFVIYTNLIEIEFNFSLFYVQWKTSRKPLLLRIADFTFIEKMIWDLW